MDAPHFDKKGLGKVTLSRQTSAKTPHLQFAELAEGKPKLHNGMAVYGNVLSG